MNLVLLFPMDCDMKHSYFNGIYSFFSLIVGTKTNKDISVVHVLWLSWPRLDRVLIGSIIDVLLVN